jgi:drug/metabolite transporter (DMT)-like permease
MTEAFSRAPASVLAPFEYSSMIWAVLLGFLAFGDIPSFPVIAGTLIIVSSGLYILHRETRRID